MMSMIIKPMAKKLRDYIKAYGANKQAVISLNVINAWIEEQGEHFVLNIVDGVVTVTDNSPE